ncbi:hypothetical protein HOL21_03140 [Candidatus Woesearchaeota archaeon]|jgi:proteasome lid subunit RPN8/RPN11|nr:hypothetical protein [Candidatus Woesearchaeota archaeon]MBT5397182.1 hypothetical protein [Candidatus Woesearchaeota archaeon]MBT5924829.1 hypothetical protein [Candidatus Woesearchaeota archaeon]MBT6367272.1 hypothetical protein [Candidatus Woesearchaeota archaeon]MBT7762582.1 hypothetical protein [Candidatus Woesearchaeota archaeon]
MHHPKELFDNIEEEPKEEPERKPIFKRIFIITISLFLIILITSFVIVQYPLNDILQGKIESDLLKNNMLETDDVTIMFEEVVADTLRSWYFGEQRTEFAVCMDGIKENDVYYITSLEQPTMYEQAFNHVSFAPCSEESLILLHTHPYKKCIASETDINTLREMQQRNADVLMVVMCEPDRFSVYS